MYKNISIRCIMIFAIYMAMLSHGDEKLNFPEWDNSKLSGSRGKAFKLQVKPYLPNAKFKQPVAMTPVPGYSGTFLIVERFGGMWILDSKGNKTPFINLKARSMNSLFHPDFPKKPIVYLRYSAREMNIVKSYKVSLKGELKALPETGKIIIQWQSKGHRGGDLLFGPDRYLYLSSGDGQKWGDPHNTAQDTSTLQASILRIDVLNAPEGKTYTVPKDNPYLGIKGIKPEIWAYGVRNPWRFTFRPGTNELWVGDNGDETWEMIRRVTAGTNHGWSSFEGSHIFRKTNKLKGPTQTLTVPVVEHNHREMRSVIGGRWYQGSRFPELKDHYIYGCHVTGKLWAFKMVAGSASVPEIIADVGGQIVSFAETKEGELLIVTMDKGIYSLERSPKNSYKPIPKLLSQTGLFDSVKDHKTALGLLPYSINLPMFRDGATSEKFIAIPSNKRIHIRHSHRKADLLPPLRSRTGLDRFSIPSGGVLMQTLFLKNTKGEKQRIETQIIMNDNEDWKFLSYKWNKEQTDAELVPEHGDYAEIEVEGGSKQNWRYPSRSECTSCHTHVTMFAPGLNLAQLNREFDYTELVGKKLNQISMFSKAGFIPPNYRAPNKDHIFPGPDNEKFSLEERSRAYLHVNCAHCHRETGLGGRANIRLLAWRTEKDTNLINVSPLVGVPGGDPNKNKLVVPGHPELSDLYRRIATNGAGRMPLFGSSQIDSEAVELIRKWIESMAINK